MDNKNVPAYCRFLQDTLLSRCPLNHLSNGARHLYSLFLGQESDKDSAGVFIIYELPVVCDYLGCDAECAEQWCRELASAGVIWLSDCPGKIYLKALDISLHTAGTNIAIGINEMKENIDYAALIKEGVDQGQLDELLAIIADVVFVPRKYIKISGVEYPYEFVWEKFAKLRTEHIRYVIYCLEKNRRKIKKIRPYLLACLFNAPDTIHNFYNEEMKHMDFEA